MRTEEDVVNVSAAGLDLPAHLGIDCVEIIDCEITPSYPGLVSNDYDLET